MKPFNTVTSVAAPLPMKDVDTDMIIPAQFLTSISREGFGENLFRRLRDGDPSFFLNQSKYRGSEILIADSNFGCGSSREHAVWALTGAGIKTVLAKSFADIFFNNSGKNGLLLVTLEPDTVDSLLQEAASTSLTLRVDLELQAVAASDGRSWRFSVDPFLKHCLLNGFDELDYLRSRLDTIRTFKDQQAKNWFFDARQPNNGSL